MIREQLRLALIGDGSHAWADRVVEFQGARANEELPPVGTLPFIMLRWISDDPMQLLSAADTSNVTSLEVWPHTEESTWAALDALAGSIIPLLAPRIIPDPESGRRYLCNYAGSPIMDSPARSWDAYARPIRFTLTVVRFMQPLDPRAQAFAAWTAGQWPEVQVDPELWDPSDLQPAVYYEARSAFVPNRDMSTMGMDVYDEILAVHVIAPTPESRVTWTETVAAAMRRAWVPYDGVYLTPEVQSVNLLANPLTDAQIVLRVPYRVLTQSILAPVSPLRVAHVDDTDSTYTFDVPTQEV